MYKGGAVFVAWVIPPHLPPWFTQLKYLTKVAQRVPDSLSRITIPICSLILPLQFAFEVCIWNLHLKFAFDLFIYF